LIIIGFTALFAVYAFANPDFVTPTEGDINPTAGSFTNTNGVVENYTFTAAEASGPIHCAITPTTTMVSCTACYSPYTDCMLNDYTPQWTTLFLVGFILQFISLVVAIISYCGMKNMNMNMLKGAGCLSCLNCIGSLAWMICAIAFRFSAAGFAISGTPVMTLDFTSFGDAANDIADAAA
jgi:hypothetical protein